MLPQMEELFIENKDALITVSEALDPKYERWILG